MADNVIISETPDALAERVADDFARLVQETGTAFRIGLERRREKLQRHRPAEPRILAAIHFAHAAGPEALVDTIMLDS